MRSWLRPVTIKLRQWFLARREFLIIGSALMIVFCTATWLNLFLPFGREVNLATVDRIFALRGNKPPPQQIVLAALSNETYGALGVSARLPFPRKHTATVMERIVGAKPRLVIVDAGMGREDLDPAADNRLERAIAAGPVTIFSGLTPRRDATPEQLAQDTATATYAGINDPRFSAAAKRSLNMWFLTDFGAVYRIAANDTPAAPLEVSLPLVEPLESVALIPVGRPGPRDLINFYAPPARLR